MIFYFSATGNSKYVAKRLAEVTEEELVDIAQCRKESRYRFHIKKRERIGIVCPTYFWGLPHVVEEFLKRMEFIGEGKHYTYAVLTFGSVTGAASLDIAKYLKEKGYPLHASFAIRMVDTYTPMYDVKDKEKNHRQTAKAEEYINLVIPKVLLRVSGENNRNKGVLYGASPAARKAYDFARKTSNFKVKDNCIGCGVCANGCPEEAIIMKNGKPVWLKKSCSACLSCLHHCPQDAIVYAKLSENRGQFVNPNV